MNIQAGVNQLLTLGVGASYLGNRAATENLDVAKKFHERAINRRDTKAEVYQEKLDTALEGLDKAAAEHYGEEYAPILIGDRDEVYDYNLEKKGGIRGKRKLAKQLISENVGVANINDTDFSNIEHYKQRGQQQIQQAQDFENFKNSLKEAGVHPNYINRNPETIKKKYEEFKKDGGNI